MAILLGTVVQVKNDGRSLEDRAGPSADGKAKLFHAVVRDNGTDALAARYDQDDFGIDRAGGVNASIVEKGAGFGINFKFAAQAMQDGGMAIAILLCI